MKLSAAASRFDRMICTDAYDANGISFKGQLDLFDDSKKDSLGASRRVLSAAPAVSIPPRRTVKFADSVWLLSSPYYDYFLGSAIRQKFSAQECEGLAQVRTFAQVLGGSTGLQAYAGKTFIKTGKDEASSDLTNRFDFFLASGEQVAEKQVITLDSVHYIVRTVTHMPTEFVKATVDQVKGGVEQATFVSRTYAPVTDTYATTSAACNLLRVVWHLDFEHLSASASKYLDGDVCGFVRKSDVAQPRAGDKVVLVDGEWVVQYVASEAACWSLHLRRD